MQRGVALFIKQGNMAGTEQVTHPKRLELSREGQLCRFEPIAAVATPFGINRPVPDSGPVNRRVVGSSPTLRSHFFL